MNTIKVYLVDDHEMIRIGIKKTFEKHSDIEVVTCSK